MYHYKISSRMFLIKSYFWKPQKIVNSVKKYPFIIKRKQLIIHSNENYNLSI